MITSKVWFLGLVVCLVVGFVAILLYFGMLISGMCFVLGCLVDCLVIVNFCISGLVWGGYLFGVYPGWVIWRVLVVLALLVGFWVVLFVCLLVGFVLVIACYGYSLLFECFNSVVIVLHFFLIGLIVDLVALWFVVRLRCCVGLGLLFSGFLAYLTWC